MLNSAFEIHPDAGAVQSIRPGEGQRFEGVAFSPSGDVLGVATSEANSVLLFRRQADGRFESEPYCSLDGNGSGGLAYPHDISFSTSGLMAVAQRGGAIALYQRNRGDGGYGPAPVFEIGGREAGLSFSDGVAFVPPADRFLAVCNLKTGSISFYGRSTGGPVSYRLRPVFVLKHPSLRHPDGLAFSSDGQWLAVANHGNHTVSIFRRRSRLSALLRHDKGIGRYLRRARNMLLGRWLRYGPEPAAVIRDDALRFPHSVAFTPRTHCLVVTSSGANHFSVYQPSRRRLRWEWPQTPVCRHVVGLDDAFREVNMRNKMEGGPKGVAIHGGTLAVCSPEYGVKIYLFKENS